MSYHPQITFEVLHINNIEPYQRRIQEHIELGQLRSQDVGSAVVGDELLELVQRTEDGDYGSVVGGLVGGEAGSVDAAVEVAG